MEYQWYADGTPVPGATSATFDLLDHYQCLPEVSHQVYCEVRNGAGAFRTRTATITLVVDGLPFHAEEAAGDASSGQVTVSFDRHLLPASAADPFSYVLQDEAGRRLDILEAVVQPDARHVRLQLAADVHLQPGQLYRLRMEDGTILSLCPEPLPPTVLSFRPMALAGCGSVVLKTTLPLLDFGSVWKYHPNSNDTAFAASGDWVMPAFDDAAWPSGQGLFGVERNPGPYLGLFGPFRTLIPPPGGGSGPLSTFFRTHFQWHDSHGRPDGFLNFTNAVDDGIVVYLNGEEIFSFNVPASPRPLPWDAVSLPAGSSPLGEGVPVVTNLLVHNLREGDNLLTVALHQQGITSGDDVFGMKLTGLVDTGDPFVSIQPTNQSVSTEGVANLLAEAPPGLAASFQWFENDRVLPEATSPLLRITNYCGQLWVWGSRTYFCRITTPLCSFDTRTALVHFFHDDIPPRFLLVRSSRNGTNILADFDRPMDRSGAEEVFSYELEEEDGHLSQPLSASLDPAGSRITLSLTSQLLAGATYRLRVPEFQIRDRCGNAMGGQSVVFVAWTATVALRVERVTASQGRLRWDDSSMVPEGAPTPEGPWTALPAVTSGQSVTLGPASRFFRLRRLPE